MMSRVARRAAVLGAFLAAIHGTALAQETAEEPAVPQIVTAPNLTSPFDAEILVRIRQAILAGSEVTEDPAGDE